MNSKEKILKVIFENPTSKFHIRELARKTKLNPNTIINMMNKLEKQNIIKKEKKKHLTEISPNIKAKEFIQKKRIFNLSQLYKSNLLDYLEKQYKPEAISVIGTYSKGEDIEKSDVDIVVICDKEKTTDLTRFEKFLSRKIHLIITNYKKMSKEFYINLINGIILEGYLEKR